MAEISLIEQNIANHGMTVSLQVTKNYIKDCDIISTTLPTDAWQSIKTGSFQLLSTLTHPIVRPHITVELSEFYRHIERANEKFAHFDAHTSGMHKLDNSVYITLVRDLQYLRHFIERQIPRLEAHLSIERDKLQ